MHATRPVIYALINLTNFLATNQKTEKKKKEKLLSQILGLNSF